MFAREIFRPQQDRKTPAIKRSDACENLGGDLCCSACCSIADRFYCSLAVCTRELDGLGLSATLLRCIGVAFAFVHALLRDYVLDESTAHPLYYLPFPPERIIAVTPLLSAAD
ncbi:hypothetical protein [Pseudomonas syringae]|uniref:hypothetical protein n=1 Tax=Pseudomonas syringae TaxID=317 RepID=UPI0018E6418D|nr:hypothetical protein [Pseudomonas syringae]MBI6740402.1 hypothetical protein [Pseudomonas syringae]MBI6745969.1 hypothetical protein [Pseudomonas syringae]MBI6760384.1 hypothetical protein [Pseudomonas syringae]MBI6808790.1 hypothetical protein [Pseudomonas syringae]MBI6829467.1 hypothetical protein [Pseudomonas syringae]